MSIASLVVSSVLDEMTILVAVIMGSDSDLPALAPAVKVLEEFGVGVEVRVLSAHRTPLEMVNFAQNAKSRGLKVIIAGAGGAAPPWGILPGRRRSRARLRTNPEQLCGLQSPR